MDLLLIGPRASGKTTIGRVLAEQAGVEFVDLDDMVLATFAEPTVRLVWATHGEVAWRSAEVWCLRQALNGQGRVIALGGGTPVIPDARLLIDDARQSGRATAVYLNLPASALKSRLQRRSGDRPSLTGGDVAEEVATVVEERRPIYEGMADFTLEVSEVDAASAARTILESTGYSGAV